MISVYLAGRYQWAVQIETVAKELRSLLNVKVVSEWHRWKVPEWMTPEQIAEFARQMDVEGVRGCNVFIFFRKPPARPVRIPDCVRARGGRYIELGMAIALGKIIIAVGKAPREELSVFEMHEDISVWTTVRGMIAHVDSMAGAF